MTLKKSDDAISPVIGVMLMLAVTAMIAVAVVSLSTGMVTDTSVAPSAVLEVKIDRATIALIPEDGNYDGEDGDGILYIHESTVYSPDIMIRHVSGDALPTKDLELHFTWTHDIVNDEGETEKCSHSSTYSAEKFAKEHPGYKFGDTFSQPLTCELGLGNYAVFGDDDFVLKRGVTARTPIDYVSHDAGDIYATINTGSVAMDAILNDSVIEAECEGDTDTRRYIEVVNGFYPNPELYFPEEDERNRYLEYTNIGYTGGIMDHLPAGTPVDVTIVHIPSGKPVYDKTIYVTESFTFVDYDEYIIQWYRRVYPDMDL